MIGRPHGLDADGRSDGRAAAQDAIRVAPGHHKRVEHLAVATWIVGDHPVGVREWVVEGNPAADGITESLRHAFNPARPPVTGESRVAESTVVVEPLRHDTFEQRELQRDASSSGVLKQSGVPLHRVAVERARPRLQPRPVERDPHGGCANSCE